MQIDADGASLHLSEQGDGPPLLLLNGGGGCPNYLGPVAELLPGFRCLLPDPRGTGQSTGGVHALTTALADLETIREALELERWTVLGHSWGADLGLAYTLTYPERVARLVSWAGTGIQNDRDWHAAYEAGKDAEPRFEVPWNPAVHRALLDDWRRFIKTPDLLARRATGGAAAAGGVAGPARSTSQRLADPRAGTGRGAAGGPSALTPPPFGGRSPLAPAPTLRA